MSLVAPSGQVDARHARFGWGGLETGLFMAAICLVLGALQALVVGRLSRTFGEPVLLGAGMLIAGTSLVALGLAREPVLLGASALGVALGAGLAFAPSRSSASARSMAFDTTWVMTPTRAITMPVTPPPFLNHGTYAISLSDVVKWLASQAEARGVPGFPTAKPIFDGRRVIGVQVMDRGIDKDSKPKGVFEPGAESTRSASSSAKVRAARARRSWSRNWDSRALEIPATTGPGASLGRRSPGVGRPNRGYVSAEDTRTDPR